MRARSRFALILSLFAVSSLLSAELARAEHAPARSLVRLLASKKKLHPLAEADGRVPVTAVLPPGKDARSVGLLPVAPGIGAARLLPEAVDAFVAAHPEISLSVTPPLLPLLDVSTKRSRLDVFRTATGGGTGKGVVVGIVDTGLDVAHPDFRDAQGKSRVAWMLEWGRQPVGLHPDVEAAFFCDDPAHVPCAVFAAEDLDAMMSGQLALALPADHEGHGTHVTGIAAGNGGIMNGATPSYAGIAPDATLVISAPSSEAGFRDDDLLDAVRFVFDRADAIAAQAGHPVPAVVNMSVGGDFGPHDGSSTLEKGLAAFVGDDKPGRAIVLAAGNSGALYGKGDKGPFGIHTEVHVNEHGETRVPISTPKASKGKGFVWITFQRGDEVSVGLDGPGDKTWISLVEPGDETGYDDGDGTTGAVVNKLVNGKTPITADTNSAVVAFDGAWDAGEFVIRLAGHGTAQLWVTGLGDVSPSKSEGLLFERAVRQGTIAVPASHPELIAVGCTLNRVEWEPLTTAAIQLAQVGGEVAPLPDSLCYFSAAGPTPFGVMKPEISAPGGFVASSMSAQADPRVSPGGLFDGPGCPDSEPCYVVDDTHAVTAGTSMSAPHVAGAAALLFELDPTLTQARLVDVLQAGARYPTGTVRHETQLGVGALDIEGARRALLAEGGVVDAPSIAKSWWVLGSAYARPDPTWPVWGTIELRREDGEIASGLAGTQLEVSVTGGVLVEPITKVRHGLFRFAVAAEKGSGGSKMVVDVRFLGQSIEKPREILIGDDAWRSNGKIDATSGGCAWPDSAESASRGAAPYGSLLPVAVAGIGLARRRRRKGS